jgi:hypothetical protein
MGMPDGCPFSFKEEIAEEISIEAGLAAVADACAVVARRSAAAF